MSGLKTPYRRLINRGFNPNQDTAALVFDEAAARSAYRTPSIAGNSKKWTWSGEFKLADLAGDRILFSAAPGAHASAPNISYIAIDTSKRLRIYGYGSSADIMDVATTQKFDDPNAKYFVTVSCDTTQATASDRLIIDVGVDRVTDFDIASYPALDATTHFNTTNEHRIADEAVRLRYKASIVASRMIWLDGVTKRGTDFCKLDSRGVLVSKPYTGSFGTNGFQHDYSDNSTAAALFTDSSPNGLTYTSVNFATTNQSKDAWSNNFCTWDLLSVPPSGVVTIFDGLTRAAMNASNSVRGSFVLPDTGVYYWEQGMASSGYQVGVIATSNVAVAAQSAAGSVFYYGGNGDKYVNGTSSSYGSAWTSGVVGVLFDATNQTIDFRVGGAWQGEISLPAGYKWVPGLATDAGTSHTTSTAAAVNFGQKDFSGALPSGAKSLCTANLPRPPIPDGSNHMVSIPVSHNGTSTDFELPADASLKDMMLLIKRRSTVGGTAEKYFLVDGLRGYGNYVSTDGGAAEVADANVVSVSGTTGTLLSTLANDDYLVLVWVLGDAGGQANTDGSITSNVSANTDAGISVVEWDGTGVGGIVGSGLSRPLEFVSVKNLDDVSDFFTWLSSLTAQKLVKLNDTVAESDFTTGRINYSSVPTDGTFRVESGSTSINSVNGSPDRMWALCMHSVEGFSKGFEYNGNANANGRDIDLGFTPEAFFLKGAGSSSSWVLMTRSQNSGNPYERYVLLDTTGAETTFAGIEFIATARGIKVAGTQATINQNAIKFVGFAFARWPFGGKGIAPATAF